MLTNKFFFSNFQVNIFQLLKFIKKYNINHFIIYIILKIFLIIVELIFIISISKLN